MITERKTNREGGQKSKPSQTIKAKQKWGQKSNP